MEDHLEFSVERMAKLFGVSRSGYYRYVKTSKSVRKQQDSLLLEKIKMIYEQNRQAYGSPRIHQALKEQGEHVSRKRVARIMRENNIQAKKHRLFKTTTRVNSTLPVADNHLQQDFSASKPNQKWVSDITYVWTAIGWLYVAAIMDLFSRKIIGLSMNTRMTKQLVINAFNQAISQRGVPEQLIYHSDRGSQYASEAFQKLLKHHAILPSMSGAGNCYDNAAMESFFATLKTECVYFENYQTPEEAKISIFDYTEIFYNNQRLHSYLGYLSPKAFEQRFYHRENSVH